MSITRRDAFKIGAVAVGATVISGCSPSAQMKTHHAKHGNSNVLGKHQVVIIGGGWGGLTVAKELKKIDKNFDVLIIEKNETFVSCPFSNTYLGKIKGVNLGTLTHDYAQAIESNGYNMLQSEVTSIDRGAKLVHTAKGTISYDMLVLAPGIAYDYESQFPNWSKEKIAKTKRVAPAAMIAGTGGEHIALERMISDMDDGTVVITVPAGKYRCPPAPFERASMIAAYMKKEEINGKIIIINEKNAISKGAAFKESWKELYGDMITNIMVAKIDDVNLDSNIVKYSIKTGKVDNNDNDILEAKEVKYNVLNFIPYNKANSVVAMSGVETTKDSFGKVRMNGCSFQSKSDASIYAVGDVVGHAVPPSGQTAVWAGKECAKEIAHVLHGKTYTLPVKSTPQKSANVCYSMVGDNPEEGISVSHTFSWTGAVIKGKGHVPKDATSGKFRSKGTGKATHEWYKGAMRELLG